MKTIEKKIETNGTKEINYNESVYIIIPIKLAKNPINITKAKICEDVKLCSLITKLRKITVQQILRQS